MDDKLLKFRQESAQKQKEQEKVEQRKELVGQIKTYFNKFWTYGVRDEGGASKPSEEATEVRSELRQRRKPPVVTKAPKAGHATPGDDEPAEEDEEELPVSFKLQLTKLVLQAVLWLTLFVLFVKLEFGAVYFVVSSLVIIYLNTGKRKSSTLSAYSVFNPNVERIYGTMTPEQLQSSLLGGL